MSLLFNYLKYRLIPTIFITLVLFICIRAGRWIESLSYSFDYVYQLGALGGIFLVVNLFLMIKTIFSSGNIGIEYGTLNGISSGLLVVDLNGQIKYVNESAKTILENIAQWLPVIPKNIIGFSYFKLYGDFQEQKNLCQSPAKLPYKYEEDIGGETLEVQIVPRYTKNGRYLGPLVLWRDITQAKTQEKCDQFIKTGSTDLEENSQTLRSVCGQMQQLNEKTLSHTNDTSTFAEEVSANINNIADVMEENTVSVTSISKQTNKSFEIAQQAIMESEKANQMVTEFAEMVNEISKMTKNIKMIMEQTTVLALNARIEAEKAGDAGKGFGVIADKVNGLSLQTAEVTKQIAQLAQQLQHKIPESVASMEAVQSVINEISSMTQSINEDMRLQTIRSNEMNDHMHQANDKSQQIVTHMNEVVIQNRQTMEEIESTLNIAENIQEISENFKIITKRLFNAGSVTPNDVFPLMIVANNMIDALLKEKCSQEIVENIDQIKPQEYQEKQPQDVINMTLDTAKRFIGIMNLQENIMKFPQGAITPTQVYGFILQFLTVIENALISHKIPGIEKLKKSKPVEDKKPGNVFVIINMVNEKLKLIEKHQVRL